MKMTHDEMIEVIQAHKEGKVIQYKSLELDDWFDIKLEPAWDFPSFQYRVKPEPRKPREIWVNSFGGDFGAAHGNREIAIACCRPGGSTTLFREVLEEEVEA